MSSDNTKSNDEYPRAAVVDGSCSIGFHPTSIPGLVRFAPYGGGKGRAAFNAHEISSVIENTTRGAIEIRTSNVTYAVKETDFEAVVRKIADAMNPASDRIEVLELQKELEATRAELAAERARPKGGVAWALKLPRSGALIRNSANYVTLHESESAAIATVKDCGWSWEVVPFPIGDGADELKAAIERAEKAEAEVAAWKEAANSNKIGSELVPNPATPVCLKARLEHLAGWVNGLSRRIGTGEAELRAAEAELAALKAAPAEVPPLDRWRVLSTAIDIVFEMFEKSETGTVQKSICDIANTSMKQVFRYAARPFDDVYRVN